MRYNKEQLELAESILSTIKDNGSCMDRNELLFDLQERCGYSDLPEITLRFLQDDGIIEYWGSRYIKLTNEGCDVAEMGLATYKDKLTLKQRFMIAKDIVFLIASLTAIIGFFVGLIV